MSTTTLPPQSSTTEKTFARKVTDYLEPKNWILLDVVLIGLVVDGWAGLGWDCWARCSPLYCPSGSSSAEYDAISGATATSVRDKSA